MAASPFILLLSLAIGGLMTLSCLLVLANTVDTCNRERERALEARSLYMQRKRHRAG